MAITLETEICGQLGIEYPVFAFNHCRDVVAAVSNAGGLGVSGVTMHSAEGILAEANWIKKHTDNPFGLDVLLPAKSPAKATREDLVDQIPQENIDFMNKLKKELGLPDEPKREPTDPLTIDLGTGGTAASQQEQVDAICEVKPAVFAGGLGMTADTVEKCHSAGIKVISLVGNVRQAKKVAAWGVDYIVAQGTEAGGHTGRIGTLALVPAVVDAVKPIPVIAAGGIGGGRGLAAALALWAVGAWTGTIWLTSHEYPLDDFIKDRILNATEEDAIITRVQTGKTARSLKSKFIEYWDQPGAPEPAPAPYQPMYLPVPWWTTTENPNSFWEEHDLQDWIRTAAGQVIAQISERKSVKQILFDMVSEAMDIIED